jgi:PAS domain S-box-containing protein
MLETKPATKTDIIRVLHVDDDTSLLMISAQILSDIDGCFDIDTALSVDNALCKLAYREYDVIISDYDMPLKSGLDFLKQLREQKMSTPFILFTGKGREEVAVQALNMGATRYLNKQGDCEAVYTELAVSIRQLYEKDHMQKLLSESEARFERMVSNIKDMVMLTQVDGKILYLSPSCKDILGYEPSELVGTTSWAIHPDDSIRVQKIFKAALTTEMSGNEEEYKIVTKQGDTRWVNHSFSQITENGKIRQIVSVIRDITKSKQTEMQLFAGEERYRMIAENMQDVITVTDLNGLYTYVSPSIENTLGYTPAELLEKNAFELIHPDDVSSLKPSLSIVLSGGEIPPVEFRFKAKTGSYLWLEGNLKAFKDATGETKLLVVSRNIAGRRKAEEELKASEERYRALFEQTGDYIIVLEVPVAGVPIIYDANDYALNEHGYSREELIGKSITFLDINSSESVIMERVKLLLKNGKLRFEAEHRRKDGTQFTVEVINKHVKIGKRDFLLSVERDITERKKYEETLKQSNLVFNNSLDMICMAGFDGYFKVLNPAWSKTLGWTNEELLSRPWLEFVYTEDRNATAHARVSLVNGQEVVQFKNRYICKDGSVRWLSWNSFPDLAEKKIFAVARDVTDRKEADVRLEAVNEKLRVVGKLTRHDVRNKLAVINANSFLLKKRLCGDTKAAEYLTAIDLAAAMADRLFEFGRLYEQIGAEEHTTIEIKRCFDEAVTLLPNLHNIKIINACQGLVVEADSLLGQLFYNLVDNSLRHGKKVTQVKLYYLEEDDQILLYYEDDGVGISKENKAKLFSEGFTTGGGTGLGLAMTKKVLQVYGWDIIEEGEPNKGAKFVITIPKVTGGTQTVFVYTENTQLKS